MPRYWKEFSPRQRTVLITVGASDAALKSVALIDLARRPAAEVKGPKWAWLLVILVNSAGLSSLAYLLFGRRRH